MSDSWVLNTRAKKEALCSSGETLSPVLTSLCCLHFWLSYTPHLYQVWNTVTIRRTLGNNLSCAEVVKGCIFLQHQARISLCYHRKAIPASVSHACCILFPRCYFPCANSTSGELYIKKLMMWRGLTSSLPSQFKIKTLARYLGFNIV